MKKTLMAAAVALLGLSGIALSTTSASAAIVCNGEGHCWHTRYAYTYHPEWGLVVHPNGWRWGVNDHFVWREHTGRGYWHNGVWIRF